MSHFVKCLLPRLLSPRVSSSPPPLASQVGGTKTRGEEVRKGIEDVQRGAGTEAVHLACRCLSAVVLNRSLIDAHRTPCAVLGAETFERGWQPVFFFCSSEQACLTKWLHCMFS